MTHIIVKSLIHFEAFNVPATHFEGRSVETGTMGGQGWTVVDGGIGFRYSTPYDGTLELSYKEDTKTLDTRP